MRLPVSATGFCWSGSKHCQDSEYKIDRAHTGSELLLFFMLTVAGMWGITSRERAVGQVMFRFLETSPPRGAALANDRVQKTGMVSGCTDTISNALSHS